MRLSLPRSLRPGWVAVCPSGSHLDLLLVEPGEARPRVKLLRSLAVANDPAAIQGELRKRLELKNHRLVTLLGAGEYQLLQVDAPTVPREEWKTALRWRLKDLVEFPPEEAVFDVLDIPTEEFAPTRQRSAFMVVAQRRHVATHLAPFLGAKQKLAAVDVPEIAQRNVAALFEEENRGIACIAFDEAGVLLTVSYRGELYAARRVDVSLAQIGGADDERRRQLFERIALEAQRTLDAFDRQYSFMSISKLLVAPRPELFGLSDVLAANLYIPLETMDLSKVLDFGDDPALDTPAERSRVLHAIGAALRGEGAA